MSLRSDSQREAIPSDRFEHLRVGFALEAGDGAARVQLEMQRLLGESGSGSVDRDGLREDAMHALGYLVGFGQAVFGEDMEEVRSQLLLAAAAEAALPVWKVLSEAGTWRYDPKAGARESALRGVGGEAAEKVRQIAAEVFQNGTAIDAPARQFVVTMTAHLEQLAGELREAGETDLAARLDDVVRRLDRRAAAADEIAELWCRFQVSRSKPRAAALAGADSDRGD